MSPHRVRAMFAGGGLATLAAAAALALAGGPTPATAADRSAGDRAEALTAAPAQDDFSMGRQYAPGAESRDRAAEKAGAVPLPPGQAFDDINWENGTLSDVDIEALLEFNAACRWWIADADAPTKESGRVVAAIPAWPTMRGGERHDAAAAMSSGANAELAALVLGYCRAASKNG